jgi:hypothetical protein
VVAADPVQKLQRPAEGPAWINHHAVKRREACGASAQQRIVMRDHEQQLQKALYLLDRGEVERGESTLREVLDVEELK